MNHRLETRRFESAVEEWRSNPEIGLYRSRTLGMLRRYLRVSVELGRLPSLVGREFFRSRVTSYRLQSFEDAVILAHDVERCLERLELFEQQLVARVVMQEHTHDDAASLLGCTRRTVTRRLPDALDHLSALFLTCQLLEPMGGGAEEESEAEVTKKPCQEAEDGDLAATA